MMKRLPAYFASIVLSTCVSDRIGFSQELPTLPGPGLELPVDVDGDGISSYSDNYVFNNWLELGGNLTEAIAAGQVKGEIIDLSEFFSGSEAALYSRA